PFVAREKCLGGAYATALEREERLRASGDSVLAKSRSAVVGWRKPISFNPRGIFLPSAFAFATTAAARASRSAGVPGFSGGDCFTSYILASTAPASQTLPIPEVDS